MRRHPARLRFGLAVVCLGALVGPFDTTVNTAFPAITEAFALAPHEIQWVVIAYVLAQSSFALLAGRVGDLFGHRRVFAIGLVACALSHAAVALAPDFPSMIAARALQGLAVGIVISCAVALATLPFPPEDKPAVIATYVTATTLAMAAAPWLGGVLVGSFGWQGVYWFRVPLALSALLLMHWAMPRVPRAAAAIDVPGAHFDWVGAVGFVGAMSLVVLGVAESARPGGNGVAAALAIVAGGAVAFAFVRHEARCAHPVIRVDPFRNPRFASVQLASVAINFACFSNLLLLPYVLARSAGVSIGGVGLLLSLYPGGAVLGSFAAGRAARRLTPAALAACGLFVSAGGLVATAAALAAGSMPGIAAGMALSGAGTGLFQVGYLDATTSMLPAHERGVAGSLVIVTRLLGVVFGASGISWLQARTASEAVSFAWLGGALFAAAISFAVLRGDRRWFRSA